jgi:cell division protein FtsQ
MGVLMRLIVIALFMFGSLLLVVTRLTPKVDRIEVSGNLHYNHDEVLTLADVKPGDPFLWVTSWRVAELARDPWIARVRVTRHWPHTVSIMVWERQPVATDGETTWAQDGTVLPGVDARVQMELVKITGWGLPRVIEALELVPMLEPFGLQMISYTPEGFEIQLPESSLFTPSVRALRDHWGAVVSQQGRRVAVYPWGVSRADD